MNIAKDRGELTITLRMKGRPVVVVGEGPVAEEHRTLLTRAGAVLVGEGSKAAFAVVIDDRAAVSRLKVRGALVYAVGEPDLCDFTLANPTPPAKPAPKEKPARPPKPARKEKPAREVISSAVPETVPDSAAEPVVAQAPRATKVRQEPVARAPREPLKMPNISLDPARQAWGGAKRFVGAIGQRTNAILSPMLNASTPLTRTVASTIQSRVDRARERPISLDLALVKGGPLDEQGGSRDPETQKAQDPQA
jgi:hypothetical protein